MLRNSNWNAKKKYEVLNIFVQTSTKYLGTNGLMDI